MKILHIIPNLKKGGAERLALDICIELQKRQGIEVCLVTFSEENDYQFLSKLINHNIISSDVIPSITGKDIVNIEELNEFISECKPDIIHSHLFKAEIVSRWQPRTDSKYFTHCHDNMHQMRNFSFTDIFSKKRLTELYEKRLITKKYKRCNNQFIAISEHTKSYFENVLPSSQQSKVQLLHNAIDYAKFYTQRTTNGELILVNTGSFVEKKNQQLFIPIVQSILKRGITCKAVLLGEGMLRNKIQQEIEKLNLQEFFILPGNVPDVEVWLKKATVYVHTATYEPFGLVLLEAMASGLPVVSLNGGGNADIMEDGKNGFIVNEQNPELFADKILEIWQDKELYNTISIYAQEYAKQFDIKEYVDRLLEIYNG